MAKREKPNAPHPSSEQVEHYLRAWDELENYHLQEDALDKLFFTLCPENSNIYDRSVKYPFQNHCVKFSRYYMEKIKEFENSFDLNIM